MLLFVNKCCTAAALTHPLRTIFPTRLKMGIRALSEKSCEGLNIAKAMEDLANADAVCFDVDSTVIQEEGIDVLAASLGKGEEVAAWTAKAMNGGVKFEDALAARLQIIQPSKQDVESCLMNHPFQLTPGIQDLIQALHERNTHVYLVSGGFRQMIEPIASILDIPKDRIYANTLFFETNNTNNSYAGFDTTEPTSADRGKPKALMKIKQQGNYNVMVMVGDGATDAQAKPPANSFIGFGGVAVRDYVQANACWFVRDFQDLIAVVKEGKKCQT